MATVTRERERKLAELVDSWRARATRLSAEATRNPVNYRGHLLGEAEGLDRAADALAAALASPPAEDEATELREALKAQTSRADVMDRAGAYQAMELRKAHKQCRLLRAEIERLKAQAPPASEALIERLTDAVARLPERHELGDVRDAIAAALAAQAPPASDPPGQQPETAEALIQRWQHWCRKFGEAAADEDDDGDARMAQEQIWAVEADMLAYPLPAPPQEPPR